MLKNCENAMNNINFKKRNFTSGLHMLGIIFIVVGLFVFISPLIFEAQNSFGKVFGIGMGAITVGLVIIFTFEGAIINWEEKRFKEYTSISGILVGDWVELPAITSVKLFSNSYIRTHVPNGISPTFSSSITDYLLIVYADSSQPLIKLIYSKKNKALKDAKQLAEGLGAPLMLNIKE